jgi:hypothetical protein
MGQHPQKQFLPATLILPSAKPFSRRNRMGKDLLLSPSTELPLRRVLELLKQSQLHELGAMAADVSHASTV